MFSGRVQGVGFRATARSIAGSYAVSGWVRNEPDGTVLMEVQGATGAVEDFLASLRRRLGGFIASESSIAASVVEREVGFEIRR